MSGLPEPIVPMKAVLTDERFSDPDWIFERKLDGIRCIAIKGDKRVRLRSRNDLSLNGRFPEVVAALEADPATDFVIDGEVVAFAGAQTSFARLQQRGEHPVQIFLYAFDVLWLDGEDVTPLPLRERKARLRRALAFHGPVRLTPHRNRDGEAMYREACRKGWEGVIAKRADAPYTRGRSRDWLKFKCSAEQELVIGGFTAPRGTRTDLGALLLGYYEDGRLRYAGKVGTGFTQATLRDLAGGSRRCGATPRRSPTSCASATSPGPSRGSSPRSASRNGPATAACGIRASSACARTRPPPRSCARRRTRLSRPGPPA